ncbi:MAG: PIN domain-containing protein [Euryarchaeota archaeon]|nr:PIN domain-containing protein [Euryarchaeota archaeon]
MKGVIDTNVLFSALYAPQSFPGLVLLAGADGTVDLYATDTIESELERTLKWKLDYSEDDWRFTRERLPITWLAAEEYSMAIAKASSVLSDKGDVPVLAAALVLRAPVVSGDRGFSNAHRVGVEWHTPKRFVQRLEGR